jgi:hypothetical protein
MKASPPRILKVVRCQTHVEIEWMRQPVVEIEFADPHQESAYAAKDLLLAKSIEQAVLSHFPLVNSRHVVYTNDDWWPNNNRSVTLNKDFFNFQVVEALIDLLQAEYADWRINVLVLGALDGEGINQEIGAMFISPREVVLQESLAQLVKNEA